MRTQYNHSRASRECGFKIILPLTKSRFISYILEHISELTAMMTSITGFTGKEYVGGSRILILADDEKNETIFSFANKGGVQAVEKKGVDQDL